MADYQALKQTDYSQYINPLQRGMTFSMHDGGINTQEDQAAYDARIKERQGMIQQAMAQGALSSEQIDQLLKQGDIQQGDISGDYWKQIAERNKADLERQMQQIEIDKKRGYDANGRPIAKDWEGIANADGTLKDAYVMQDWQNVNADTGALDKFKQTALRDPKQQSAWAELMNEQIGAQSAQAMDQASQQGANNLLAMQSELAQSGGLSGAARERMANQNMRQQLLAKQGINRQGSMDKMNVASQDEQNRLSQLGALQQMQNQQADISFKNQEAGLKAKQFNIQNQLNENLQKRAWDANKYSEGMKEWGAAQSSRAQAGASSGGKK